MSERSMAVTMIREVARLRSASLRISTTPSISGMSRSVISTSIGEFGSDSSSRAAWPSAGGKTASAPSARRILQQCQRWNAWSSATRKRSFEIRLMALFGRDDVVPDRELHQRGQVPDADLVHQPSAIGLDRLHRKTEGDGDHGGAPAFGDHLQDLALPEAQPGERVLPGPRPPDPAEHGIPDL